MRKIKYAAARTEDVQPDTGITVKLGPGEECVLILHRDRYYALGSLCPHQNAPLSDAKVEQGQITCRRHGYRFDLQTGDCLTLGGYALPIYPVEIQDGTIYIFCWEYD